MSNPEELVIFDDVSVGYGGAPVLEGLNLRVARGAVYALLGRNGEGKTTAARCLLGLERPSSGRMRLFGVDPWRNRRTALAHVGFVPEEPDAPPGLTVRDLGHLTATLVPCWDAEIYATHLARASIPTNVPFGRLSRGQKAHVGLALALAPRPRLLVLDDPTLGLDHVARREFHEQLVEQLVEQGSTIFLTTHDISAVERIATHVGVLRGGRLVIDMELEALKAGFRRVHFGDPQARRAALTAGRTLKVEAGLWGVEAILADYQEEALDRWRKRTGCADVEVSPMSLEEIFVAVTENQGVPS